MTDFRYDITKQGSRGLRNNNPGNLKQGGPAWYGQVGVDNTGTVIFDSVENGLRALAIDLVNKQRLHGYDTLKSIFNIYAPVSDGNNPDEYALSVGNEIGIGPNESFTINSNNVKALMRAVINVEVSRYLSQYVTDQMISDGAAAVPGPIMAFLNKQSVQIGMSVLFLVAIAVYIKRHN